eukprot:TRINITY_DN67400_c3_g1_i1.p1 TRINITY_DN67400_c3_g1~~TRINITY_DN67400_c3_g1_i1.p1  ORF type:complete len:893 (+),score=143.01 TRINITY_DN67400_c3_g1_i1:111-2789(+)
MALVEVDQGVRDFELDLGRTPENFKLWWNYIQYRKKATAPQRNLLYERALWRLPHSYKIWFHYLQDRMTQVYELCIDDNAWTEVNAVFERALVFMNKMPRIWMEYCQFLLRQYKITESRQTLDRALKSLPITQHDKIWKIYLKFINQPFIPNETAIRCWKRYLQLEPYQIEDFVDYLDSKNEHTELINGLIRMLNNPDFQSVKGKTKHEYWVQLCTLLSQQKTDLLFDHNLKADTIIRSGISKFPAEVGQLWCALADFNIRLGRFDVARDVYEEGITSVVTVKDFTQIFDCYTHFEETMLAAKMETTEGHDEELNDDFGDDEVSKTLMKVCDVEFTREEELDLRFARLEHLLDRRPEVLNSVLLRQNPHNVYEWMNRVKLFEETPQKMVSVYTEAIRTIDPNKAIGKPHQLWVSFAKFYEKTKQMELARLIFKKATEVNFKQVDDLATVWTEFADFEIRHEEYERALELLRKATATNFVGPPNWKHDPSQTVQERVWKSVKLWSFYVDLDESVATAKGQINSTRNIYERIIELKVCTPQIILNYATFLQENEYWEDSFRAFEKGIALFKWPQVFDIWLAYLTKFQQRYKGNKLERLRDLYEQAIKTVPADMAKKLYLMYAKAEESYGLTKRAMDVYNRATDAVVESQKIEIYRRYIAQAGNYFGITSTREIYEKAIESLPNKFVPEMTEKWAEMELKLGEVDRARALYLYTAQLVNPDKPGFHTNFWANWKKFEVEHGNEETFKEMLRTKRSVQATYNTSGFTPMESGSTDEKKEEPKEEPPAEEPEGKRFGVAPGTEKISFHQPVTLDDLAQATEGDSGELNVDDDGDDDDVEEVEEDDGEDNFQVTTAPAFEKYSSKLRQDFGTETPEEKKKRKAEEAKGGGSKRQKKKL